MDLFIGNMIVLCYKGQLYSTHNKLDSNIYKI